MNKDVYSAVKLINGVFSDMNHTPVYRFTNENLNGVNSNIDVNGKKVLTVCSSGDQLFDFILNGASEIDTFDINVFTKYYTDFKIASILSLSYEEFIKLFFSKKGLKNVNYNELYLRIRDYISNEESLYFWDNLLKYYGASEVFNSIFFINKCDSKDSIVRCNDYLKNVDNYNMLKYKLKDFCKFNYKCIDIFDENLDISGKYDFIYLSNILDYIHINDREEYVNFVDNFVDKMKSFLNDDGELMLCYMFCHLDDYWCSVRDIKLAALYQSFQIDKSKYQVKAFDGSSSSYNIWKNKDAMVLCKKK